MRFLDTGEKIKKLRKELNIRQEELNTIGVSRNFISMVETGKRKLPYSAALRLVEVFKNKANELGRVLEIDEQWLQASAKDEALDFCNKKLQSDLSSETIKLLSAVVREYDLKELMPRVYLLYADKLYDNKLYEEAFTYYYEALEAESDKEEKAYIYNKLGKCKAMMLNYVEGITYFNKCYEYSVSSNNDKNKKNSMYNLALCYRKLEKAELALNCVDELIGLSNIDEDFEGYIGSIILKSNCYIDLKMYKQAINTLTSNIHRFADPEDKLLGYIYNSIGWLYFDNNELETALNYIDKAYRIRKIKDNINLPNTLLNKADILIKMGKDEEALQLIDSAISLAEQNQDNGLLIKCYRDLEKLHAKDSKQLKKIYLKMIDLFKATNKNEDILKTYIKLLALSSDSDDANEYKAYLETAITYCK